MDTTITTAETTTRYRCRRVLTDGHRCASPCLRGEEFCYYHHPSRPPVPRAEVQRRCRRRGTFTLPVPEDRSSIQLSIGEVLQRIAANEIDPRRAGLLLYGLQIASFNLPKPAKPPIDKRARVKPAEPSVDEITLDPALGALAPRAEFREEEEPKSSVERLLEDWDKDMEYSRFSAQPMPVEAPAAEANHTEVQQPDSASGRPALTLPRIQAAADRRARARLCAACRGPRDPHSAVRRAETVVDVGDGDVRAARVQHPQKGSRARERRAIPDGRGHSNDRHPNQPADNGRQRAFHAGADDHNMRSGELLPHRE